MSDGARAGRLLDRTGSLRWRAGVPGRAGVAAALTGRVFALLGVVVAAAACGGGPQPAPRAVTLAEELPFARVLRDGALELDALPEGALRADGLVRRPGRDGWLGVGAASRLRFAVAVVRHRRLLLEGAGQGGFRRGGGEVTVLVNERPLGRFAFPHRGRSVELEIPAELQHPGANRLELRYEGAARAANAPRVLWRRIAFADRRPESPTAGAQGRLHLPVGVRVEFALWLRPGAALRLGDVRAWGAAPPDLKLLLQVDAPEGPLAQRTIAPGAGPVELTFDRATAARIALTPTLEEYGELLPAAGVDVGEARLSLPPGPSWPTAEGAPSFAGANVLVYLIDTLRADHLGVYGYGRPTSPQIDAFARDAVVFEQARAQSSWTKPAVASLLTGLLPQRHGAVGRADPLPAALERLPERLQLAGYETFAVVTNSTVSADFGFDLGFHEFVMLGEGAGPEVHQLSDAVNRQVASWLRRRERDPRAPAHPFFAWLHTSDPHEPYAPRSPWRERFAAAPLRPDIVKGPAVWRALREDPHLDVARVAADLASLYDAEIAFNDAQFGALLERLRARHLYDETLIVLLSDHGEEFYEHGGFSHGATLYEEQLHVPLLVKFPGSWKAGTRVPVPVQHVDLLPTLLAALGLPAPDGLPGSNLMPLVAGAAPPEPRELLAHLVAPYDLLEAVRRGPAKLVRTRDRGGAVSFERYDLAADASERENLYDPDGVVDAYLRGVIARAAVAAAAAGSIEDLDPDMAERLRALGYIR